jgi:hypothetical protein
MTVKSLFTLFLSEKAIEKALSKVFLTIKTIKVRIFPNILYAIKLALFCPVPAKVLAQNRYSQRSYC